MFRDFDDPGPFVSSSCWCSPQKVDYLSHFSVKRQYLIGMCFEINWVESKKFSYLTMPFQCFLSASDMFKFSWTNCSVIRISAQDVLRILYITWKILWCTFVKNFLDMFLGTSAFGCKA